MLPPIWRALAAYFDLNSHPPYQSFSQTNKIRTLSWVCHNHSFHVGATRVLQKLRKLCLSHLVLLLVLFVAMHTRIISIDVKQQWQQQQLTQFFFVQVQSLRERERESDTLHTTKCLSKLSLQIAFSLGFFLWDTVFSPSVAKGMQKLFASANQWNECVVRLHFTCLASATAAKPKHAVALVNHCYAFAVNAA